MQDVLHPDSVSSNQETFVAADKGDGMTLFDANTTVKSGSREHQSISLSTIITAASKKQYHWKFKMELIKLHDMGWNPIIGIHKISVPFNGNSYITNQSNSGYAYYCREGNGYKTIPTKPGSAGPAYGKMINTGDIIDMFVDMDKLTLSYHRNGVNLGKAFDIDATDYKAAITVYGAGNKIQLVSFECGKYFAFLKRRRYLKTFVLKKNYVVGDQKRTPHLDKFLITICRHFSNGNVNHLQWLFLMSNVMFLSVICRILHSTYLIINELQ